MVFKVNSLRQQKNLGYTAKSPRWAIAYKFQAEKALTRLNSVSYQVGRTGTVTLSANLDPVLLSGTIVKRATLHSEDIINALDLHIGDMVFVEKGGEIIPKITAVDTSARLLIGEKVRFIRACPECGTPLKRIEGEAAWFCPNEKGCPPQIKGRIEHFISRKAMNIEGLGSETIGQFYSLGLVQRRFGLVYFTARCDSRFGTYGRTIGTKYRRCGETVLFRSVREGIIRIGHSLRGRNGRQEVGVGTSFDRPYYRGDYRGLDSDRRHRGAYRSKCRSLFL